MRSQELGQTYIVHCANLKTLAGLTSCHRLIALSCPNLTEWPDLSTLTKLDIFEYQSRMRAPDAAMAGQLIRLNTQLTTSQKARWLSIIRNVQQATDLIAALAAFETYYKEPYPLQGATTAELPPALEL